MGGPDVVRVCYYEARDAGFSEVGIERIRQAVVPGDSDTLVLIRMDRARSLSGEAGDVSVGDGVYIDCYEYARR